MDCVLLVVPQVKAQHLERDIAFLSKELKVTDEQTARNRVFFVSAKEVRSSWWAVHGW